MELTLDILLYFICDLNPGIACGLHTKGLFVGVKQFFTGMEPGQAKYLYVASLQELWCSRETLSADMTVLAMRDMALSDEELSAFPCVLILVDRCPGVPYLVNRMIDIFGRMANWDKTMHISALEGKAVQELLDSSEELLEYPVIIFDATFDVLAFSRHTATEDRNFNQTVQAGYTNANVMAQLRKKNIFNRLKKGELLVAPAAESEDETNIYLSFYSDQILLGYACVFHGKTRPENGYLDIIRLFTENISFCLKRDYENSRYGHMMYETFLLNLMNPSGISDRQVDEQIKNIEGLFLNGRFVLGVLEFYGDEKIPIQFLTRQLDREMWNVRPFIYEEQICLLKILAPDAPTDDFIRPWEQENIDRLLDPYDFSMGVSNVFYTLTDVSYAFLQAKAAQKFKKSGSRYCLYGDVYYEHMFSAMEKEMPVKYLQPEFYVQMRSYDAENGTGYCRMIRTYLECDCNATKAAEKLFVHRNTVRNMIQFVEERWKIQISDPEIKKKFILAGLVEEYLSRNH